MQRRNLFRRLVTLLGTGTTARVHRLWLFTGVIEGVVMHKEKRKNCLDGKSNHGSLLVQMEYARENVLSTSVRAALAHTVYIFYRRGRFTFRLSSYCLQRKNTKLYAICQVPFISNFPSISLWI